jgi:hypothetical protein
MSELLLIIKDFTVNNSDLVTWAVAGLILLLGLFLQRLWINEWLGERKLNKLLKNIGQESLHNVTISDGMDGKVFIENLILTSKNILLLGVKKYQGLIFAAEKIELWTQVIGNKSYKFANPLRQLESDALSLSSKIENSEIEVKVLFINGSEFPKGKPESVITISDIKEWSRGSSKLNVSEALRGDWNRLLDEAVSNVPGRDKGILIDEDNDSGENVFYLMSIMIMLSLWLAWRLI